MTVRRIVKTANGHTLNDSNYVSSLVRSDLLPNAKPVWIELDHADAVDSGAWTVEPSTLAVYIRIRNTASRDTLISQLKQWFKRGEAITLVVTFSDDAADYQKLCRCVNLVPDTTYEDVWVAQLQCGQTAWRSVAVETASAWSVTGTGGTKTVTVGGDDLTRLIATLTPSAGPASGYLYQQLYRLPNQPGIDFGYGPWCLTVNHAALVTAVKSQADGDDLRVMVNGVEVPRWISGANTTTCKIWFNLLLNAGFSLTLKTVVDSSTDIPYLEFQDTANNRTALSKIPKAGILYHGTEWFKYDGVNTTTRRATVLKRGLLGTTKQAHAAGDAFVYIQNVITLVYGNSSATAPSTSDDHYDDGKPLFNLSSSSNTEWVYDATTQFRDVAGTGRTGGWSMLSSRKGDVTTLYDIKQNADSGDPAMGALIAAYVKATGWVQETASLRYILKRACGIYDLTMTGQKYRTGTSWPTATVLKSTTGEKYVVVWTEPKPTSVNTVTAWATHTNVALGSGYKFVAVAFDGSVTGANQYAMNECLTATAEFVSGNVPTGTLLGETNNFPLSLTLINNHTDLGDQLEIRNAPMLLNKVYTLEGETYQATYDTTNAHDTFALNDPSRSDGWIRLKPGSNQLQITAVDVGTLAVALSWYKRRF